MGRPLINNMANIEHPGGFFGLTEFGTDTFFKDQALNIFNHTLTMDQWYDAFMKLTPEGNGKLNRAYLQDVVTELYWGRVPSAEELDTFMVSTTNYPRPTTHRDTLTYSLSVAHTTHSLFLSLGLSHSLGLSLSRFELMLIL